MTPSIFRVIQTDYFSSVVTVIPLVVWGIYYILPGPAGQTHDPMLAYIAFGLLLICGAILTWRWRFIVAVFDEGERADGVVIQVNFQRERGRVKYEYTYQNEKYESGNALLSNKRTRLLHPGQRVTVVVCRKNPRQAFLEELYL